VTSSSQPTTSATRGFELMFRYVREEVKASNTIWPWLVAATPTNAAGVRPSPR
jgi:hypothetical protein